MLTGPGRVALAGSAAALVAGRAFGLIELSVIGIGLAGVVGWGLISVRLPRPDPTVARTVDPPLAHAGDGAAVEMTVENPSARPSSAVEIVDPVGRHGRAHVTVPSLRHGERLTATYDAPTARRGVVDLGPAVVRRRDVLGLVVRDRPAGRVDTLTVVPAVVDVDRPTVGHGILGGHLAAVIRRHGTAEFHSLRDYVPGDDVRMIHWKASARHEGLKVKQHETPDSVRCTVLLDDDVASFPPGPGQDDPLFERGVSIAASVAVAAERAGTPTRLLTATGTDLDGPGTGDRCLRFLATATPGPISVGSARVPSHGAELFVVVTPGRSTAIWHLVDDMTDPASVTVAVLTDGTDTGPLSITARTLAEFARQWATLVGRSAPTPAATTFLR